MALFNFFKKQRKKNLANLKSTEINIPFSEIKNYLEKAEYKNRIKEKQAFDLINERINNFISGAREKIIIAENINIDSKKAEDRFKSLTNIGRRKYIESVEDFIRGLEDLQKKELKRFIKDIDRLFSVFSKSSRGNYERATILIGKEMKDIKEHLKNFSKDLTRVFDRNKEIIDLYRRISVVQQELNQVDGNKKYYKKIEDEIMLLNKKIAENKKETEKIVEEIEKIKKSNDYLKNLETKEKIRMLKTELDKNITDLKQFINFRALANFFHIFENQMDIVKAHKDDFKTAFKKDYGNNILALLDEAKLNNELITEKIKEIKNKKNEIINCQQNLKGDGVEVLLSEIKKIKSDIEELNDEKNRKKRICEKLKIAKEQIETEIKDELRKMNVVVVED